MHKGMSVGYSNTCVFNLLWQEATSIIVGWFEAGTCRNNNKWYIQPSKLLCNSIRDTVIPRLTSDPANEFFG